MMFFGLRQPLWRAIASTRTSTVYSSSLPIKPCHRKTTNCRLQHGRIVVLGSSRCFSSSVQRRQADLASSESASAAAATTATQTATSAASSATSAKPDELVVDFVVPDRPVPLADQLQAIEAGEVLAEPTFQSLGLGSWWPSGLIQSLMETLHVSCDLPWWGVIMITTVSIRCLTFPMVIYSQRNAANLAKHGPTMRKINEEMALARKRGDLYESQQLAYEMQQYNKKHNLNPLKNFAPLAVQIPVFMSMFFGLRGMANLPVKSMEQGGLFWFTDLTMADPYYLLPMSTALTMVLQLKFAADGASLDYVGPTTKKILLGLPLVLIPITMNFPAALTYYWFVTNIVSVCQARLVRFEPIRRYLNIPKYVKPELDKSGKKKSFGESVRDGIDNWKVQADIADRRAYDAQQFREAGLQAPKRTYKFNPTQVKKIGG